MKALGTLSIMVCIFVGQAQAGMTTIGAASYSGSDYNLIWDDDNNGNSVVWLDYTNARADWDDQNTWAAGLDGALTYNIDPGYTVTWDDDEWRLPLAGASSYSVLNEFGHLFFIELGIAEGDHNPDLNPPFQEFVISDYWTSTGSGASGAWRFDIGGGCYHGVSWIGDQYYGMAVRSGDVSFVPEPATMILLGLGGLLIRKRK